MAYQPSQKSNDLICIKGANLVQAITSAGVLKYHNIPFYFEDSDQVVYDCFAERALNSNQFTATLDFTDLTRERIIELLSESSQHLFFSDIDPNMISTPILLADYLFVALGKKTISPHYFGFFPRKTLNKIMLVSDSIKFELFDNDYEVVYSKDIVKDTIELNPAIVWSTGGCESMLVSWGRYQGPKKAHLSPYFVFSEVSNIQNMVQWGNLYVLPNFTEYTNLMNHLKEKIKYENDYRRKILDVVKSGTK